MSEREGRVLATPPPNVEANFYFYKDLLSLLALDDRAIEKIHRLFEEPRPSAQKIEKELPFFFVKLFLGYIAAKDKYTDKELEEEANSEITQFLEWFGTHLPGLKDQPGYTTISKWALKVTKEAGPGSVDASRQNDSDREESLSVVNAMRSIPFYSESFSPHLRVFFKSNGRVVLDSTGDWDDWLFVVKSLTSLLESQATSMTEKIPDAWKRIPWEKVRRHTKDTKKALRGFEKLLKENDPQAKAGKTVKGRSKKKSGS